MTPKVPMPSGGDDAASRPKPLVDHHKRLFHGFLESAPDAVVIIDGAGVIAQVNRQTENLFGYGREEMVGQPLEMLMPERYRGSHVEETRAYAADPHPQPMGRGLDLFGLRKGGEEFPIDVSISPLPSEDGALLASTIRDMTSHRHLEEELRRRTLELEAADRQKDNFLAAVVHELRSPLAVMNLASRILRTPQIEAGIRDETLGRLERQTAHMARLVDDLLDLFQVRRGSVSLRREVIDLRTTCISAVEMVQPLIESRKHHLEITQFTQPLWVSGDSTRLVQILTNLLSNAAKFTPRSGHIWLSTAQESETATVRVRDDGVGIPNEMLPHVFDLFTQVEPSGGSSQGGLGIGLALVWHLVDLHRGSVEATSGGVGKGSEFVVRLPLQSIGPDADSASEAGAP